MGMKKIRYDGTAITCIKCGKLIQRSYQTDSTIICPYCGNPFYTYSRRGVVVSIADEQLQEPSRFKAYKKLVHEIDRMIHEMDDPGWGMEA